MIWNSLGSLTYFGSQWLVTVLIVRLSADYGPAGKLALAMSVYNIFAPIAVYRMYTYQVSDVRRENTVGEYLAFRWITCAVALVSATAYAALTSPHEMLPAILLFTLMKVFSLLIDVLHGFDQVNGRMDYIGQSLIYQGLSTLVVFVVVFHLTQSLELTLAAMAAATVAVGLFFDLPHSRRFGPIRPGIRWSKALYLLRYCLPIVLAGAACAAVPSIPRQFLSHLEGASALGIYASVAAPVAIVQMSSSYIYNPLLSLFSTYYARGRTHELIRLFRRVLLGIAFVGLVCAIGLELFGGWLLGLMFGPTIDPYVYTIQPIIALAVVSGYVWFFSDLLVALRNFTGNVVSNFAGLLVALPATYFFVRHWSLNGVSFAAILAYAISGIIMLVIILRTFRSGPQEVIVEGDDSSNP